MIFRLLAPEFKVGFLVVGVGVLIAFMAMKVSQGSNIFGSQKPYFFRADSAGGLVQNSAVKMAGIRVGQIRDIILEDGRAHIVMGLDPGVKMPVGTHVELKSDGILGDKHIELIPGPPGGQELATDGEVPLEAGRGGMDDVMAEVNRVAKGVHELVDTLNKSTGAGDMTSRLGRIMANVEDITADLKQVTHNNRGKIDEIVERVRNLAKNVDTYINEESLAHVDRSLKNIEEITGKVNRGEGTLGRLINDEQTVEELNQAINNVNKFLGGADAMQTSIDFHSEFLGAGNSKSFLGVKVQPGLDRYYEIDLVSDTHGVVKEEQTDGTENGQPVHSYYRMQHKNSFKVTGLFAKNFWDLTVKGGLIENFGGAGLDYHVLGGKALTLSVEAFNFNELQVRLFAKYNFFRGVYIVAGGDNLLAKDNFGASGFIGAGLFITNDDLKTLASKVSF